MIDFTGITGTQGWFAEGGDSYDVVIASRIRLARNLSNHPFVSKLNFSEEGRVQEAVQEAFLRIEESDEYKQIVLSELSPIRRRLLLERNFISQEYSLNTDRSVILRNDQAVIVVVNEMDHLRIATIRGGLQLSRCWQELDRLDSELESLLDYSVSLEWGYMSSEVTNAGTGMRGSVMLHLPALVKSGLIEKALKAVVQAGMSVKGFFGDEEGSLGDMYQVSNQLSFGFSETDLIEKLDAIAAQLVHYERNAREEMLAKRRVELEDTVFRALGLLKYCRTVGVREAIELLSSIRLGSSLGLADIPAERLTALLFLTQKAHVQCLMNGEGEPVDNTMLDYTRANMIQEALA